MTINAGIGRVREVRVGRREVLQQPAVMSAIAKHVLGRPVPVGTAGLEGDEQADHRHGGPDKAVHLYPFAHYGRWKQELPNCRLLDEGGAFGENLSLDGLDEAGVCIGDQWKVGSTLLEVSQGRQPCWKLNLRFGVGDMAARVQRSLRAGWYCRVIQHGTVAAGDSMELVHRPQPSWSIARLLALIRDRECQGVVMGQVLALPLTLSWRKLFLRRLELGQAEDWTERVRG